MKTVTIYTDGACSGNPGPGGWGAILRYKDTEKELSGGEADYDDGGGEVDASPSAGESGGTIQDDGLDDGKSDGKGAGAGIGLSLGGAALGDDGATQDNDDDYTP